VCTGWMVGTADSSSKELSLVRDVYRSSMMYIGGLRPRMLREGVVTKERRSVQV
jgi:hypothetical protein